MPAVATANLLDRIGNTPMVELTTFDTGKCRLFAKLELQNPGGSIKDRIAKQMIEAAEKEGKLKPGMTIVEATAGNTGLGLALVATQKRYPLLLVIPDKMSREKISHLQAMGAKVIMTRSDVEKGHPEYYQDIARRLAEEQPENYYFINQFENPHNVAAHEQTTGPEIWEQMNHDVDAVVCGVGSGGTVTGLGRFFTGIGAKVDIVVADPVGSIIADIVNGKEAGPLGSWIIEGIGEDFIPSILDLSYAACAYAIPDSESLHAARALLRQEGLLGGSSSGTLLATALRYCRDQKEPKNVVTFVCDSGNKYLSKMYNDFWMADMGFLEKEEEGDLRDIMSRKFKDGSVITVKTDDKLMRAYSLMKLYDISQLPVTRDETVVGIIHESDVLNAVIGSQEHFERQVSEYMVTNLKTVSPDDDFHSVLEIAEEGYVPLVFKDGQFYGLITRMDILNHLRSKFEYK